MSYTPKDKELVTVSVDESSRVAMAIRQATNSDKVRYLERIKANLSPEEEVEENSLQDYFRNPSIYLCLFDDDIKLVDSQYILGPLIE